jgi:hypothetical protein
VLTPSEHNDLSLNGIVQGQLPERRALDPETKRKLYVELADFILIAEPEKRKEKKIEIALREQCALKQLDGIGSDISKAAQQINQDLFKLTKISFDLKLTTMLALDLATVMRVTTTFAERNRELVEFRDKQLELRNITLDEKFTKALYAILVDGSRAIQDNHNKPNGFCAFEIPLLRVPEDERLASTESDARNADFHGPNKNNWRRLMATFAANAVNKYEVQPERAICLPGVCEPQLELDIYTGLGVQEIMAAERGGGRSLTTFNRQINLLRREHPEIKAYPEDLRHILPAVKANRRINIASFDFDGYLSGGTMAISRQLLLAERAAIMVNLEAGREHREVQDAYKQSYDWAMDSYEGDVVLGSALSPQLEAKDKRGKSSLDLQRDVGLEYIYIYNIGLARVENRMESASHLQVVQDRLREKNKNKHKQNYFDCEMNFVNYFQEELLGRLIDVLENRFSKVMLKDKILDSEVLNPLLNLTTDVCFGLPKIAEIERWAYNSDSHSRMPYYSFFAILDTPLSTYSNWKDVAGFMLNIIKFGVESNSVGLMFTHSDNRRIEPSYDNTKHDSEGALRLVLKESDRLCVSLNGVQRNEYSISIETLLGSIEEYQKFSERYFMRHSKIYKDIPRRDANAPITGGGK